MFESTTQSLEAPLAGAATLEFVARIPGRHFLRNLVERRALVAQLVSRDFRTRYVGSSAGWLWGVVHPIVQLLIWIMVFKYWFEVTLGAGRSHHQLSPVPVLRHPALVAVSGDGDALGGFAGGTIQSDHPHGVSIRGGAGLDLSLVDDPSSDRRRAGDSDRRTVAKDLQPHDCSAAGLHAVRGPVRGGRGLDRFEPPRLSARYGPGAGRHHQSVVLDHAHHDQRTQQSWGVSTFWSAGIRCPGW